MNGDSQNEPSSETRAKCLNEFCSRPAHVRGLCAPCRAMAKRMILKKERTEEELIQTGKLLPKKSAHPPTSRSIWFMK